MIRVVLIGNGNLAYHLHLALLLAKEVDLLALSARRESALSEFDASVARIPLGAQHPDADIYILAVSDQVIGEVSEYYDGGKALFVHTSGAMGLEVIKNVARKGVFYPLQTFSMYREVDFESVPLCIEALNERDINLLTSLARALSHSVYEISTEKRRILHLSAVYLNNFSNHMIHLGSELVKRAELPEAVMQPLLFETFEKIRDISAFEAQTGPARRKDTNTLKAHLELLEAPLDKELYQLISESIQRTYE